MRAVRYHAPGGPEKLVLEDVPVPKPATGESLVRVHAAGVNPVDAKIVAGGFPNSTLPCTLGIDFAGTVEQSDVFTRGQRVVGSGQGFGVRRDGAYAEYVTIPSGALVAVPDNMPLEVAAGLGVVWLTAWMVIFDAAVTRRDEWVLVHGASGGVGGACVQLAAKIAHARVIAVVSDPQSGERVRAFGATEVVDRTRQSVVNDVRRVTKTVGANVIVDVVGGVVFEASVGMLAPYGRLVSVGVSGGAEHEVRVDLVSLYRSNRRIVGVNSSALDADARGATLKRVVQALGAGDLEAPAVEVLPLADAASAHARLVSREGARGKIVLSV